MIPLEHMSDAELTELAKDLIARPFIEAPKQDLPKVGSLVRLMPGSSSQARVHGILGTITLWLDRNSSHAFPRSESRIALVRLADSVLPVVRNGTFVTSEECLVYEEDLELVEQAKSKLHQLTSKEWIQ